VHKTKQTTGVMISIVIKINYFQKKSNLEKNQKERGNSKEY
jgi:hypothetical protein